MADLPFLIQVATRTFDEIRISLTVLRPPAGRDATISITTIALTVPALPLGPALRSVTPGPDEVSISVAGQDVPLAA